MAKLTWTDSDEIGYMLYRKNPDKDPMSVRFTDLHQFVINLDGFTGDPKASNEGLLEKIQLAWAEYYHERA